MYIVHGELTCESLILITDIDLQQTDKGKTDDQATWLQFKRIPRKRKSYDIKLR